MRVRGLTTNRNMKTNHYNFKSTKPDHPQKKSPEITFDKLAMLPKPGDIINGEKLPPYPYEEVSDENPPRPGMVLKTVTRVFCGETMEWWHVLANDEEFKCTAEHPFYVIGKGYVEACDLQPCDELLTADGKECVITKVWCETLDKPEKTYNFEVEGYHNYFVGETGILVHNRCTLGERMERQGLLKPGEDAHHLYPQKFRPEFKGIGIEVDDVINGIPMESVKHRALAQAYNAKWVTINETIGIKYLSTSQAQVYMKQFMIDIYGIPM